MKRILLSVLFISILCATYTSAREYNTSKHQVGNPTPITGEEYSGADTKSSEMNDKTHHEMEVQQKKEQIQNSIKEKQKEITEVQKRRGSMRSIEADVGKIKLEIKSLQTELNTVK